MKFISNKLSYFDSFGIEFIPDIIKNQYKKIITNIYRIQSDNSNECGKFCIMFIKSNIQNESEKDASGFLSDLFSKIPILNKVI